MVMNLNFTKEQLISAAHSKIEFAEMMLSDDLEPLKERTWSIELELARIALASLEAEPVAYMHRSGQVVTREECCDDKTFAICCKVDTPLYNAPPATRAEFNAWNNNTDCPIAGRDAKTAAWLAWSRRAAMLHGADGVLTNEDTKRVGELVMWVKRLAHSLRNAISDSKLHSDAMEYLNKKGLIRVEDILR